MRTINSRFGKATIISLSIHTLLGLAIAMLPIAQKPHAAEAVPTLIEIVPARVLSMGDMNIAAEAPKKNELRQEPIPDQNQSISANVLPEAPQPLILQGNADVPALAPLVASTAGSVESVKTTAGLDSAKNEKDNGDGGIINPANVLRGPAPKYPAAARRAGWEGAVLVRILIDTGGFPSTVTVRESSGYTALDESVVESVRQWRFSPATKNGKPVASFHDVRVRFRLTDAG